MYSEIFHPFPRISYLQSRTKLLKQCRKNWASPILEINKLGYLILRNFWLKVVPMFDIWKEDWALAPVSCNFSYYCKIFSFNSFRFPSQLVRQLGYNIFIPDIMYLFSFGESNLRMFQNLMSPILASLKTFSVMYTISICFYCFVVVQRSVFCFVNLKSS